MEMEKYEVQVLRHYWKQNLQNLQELYICTP
jgi:hypothetical protein